MTISVKVDARQAIHYLKGIKDSQLPFAMAKGLTMTAQDVQTEIIKDLPQRFTLRTKWYQKNTPYGFKITAAKKNKLVSSIFTKAPWIQDFEEGATRTPQGQTFAVPTGAVRRSKRLLIPKGQKPRQILHKTRPGFIKAIGSKAGIFYSRTKNSKIALLYVLIKKAVIKPRLGFGKTAKQVVNARFTGNMIKAFNNAIKTAR